MGVLSRLRDAGANYLLIRRAETKLLELVRYHGKNGRGLNLPPDTLTNPAKAHLAIAAQNIVNRSNGAITIQRFQTQLVLIERSVQDAQITEQTQRELGSGFTATPGDDPFIAYDPEMVNKDGVK